MRSKGSKSKKNKIDVIYQLSSTEWREEAKTKLNPREGITNAEQALEEEFVKSVLARWESIGSSCFRPQDLETLGNAARILGQAIYGIKMKNTDKRFI